MTSPFLMCLPRSARVRSCLSSISTTLTIARTRGTMNRTIRREADEGGGGSLDCGAGGRLARRDKRSIIPCRLLLHFLQRLGGGGGGGRGFYFGGERFIVRGGFQHGHFAALGLQVDDGASGRSADGASVAVALGMQGVAEIEIGLAARRCCGQVEFRGGRQFQLHIAEVNVDVHFCEREFAGAQLDVAALN